jgi:hypothetical protein
MTPPSHPGPDSTAALSPADLDPLRTLLCALHRYIQDRVIASRRNHSIEELSAVVAVTEADTLYRIDKLSEDAITTWFRAHWPARWPVEIVMEGVSKDDCLVYPEGSPRSELRFKCIIDPIDGTRSLMYDKRSAWILTGIAPHRGDANRLRDIEVAVMTELPTSKQNLADQISAIRGRGREGIVAQRFDVDTGTPREIAIQPSGATDLHHGFASISRFFPQGKALLAEFEQALLERLYGAGRYEYLEIFDDQYICSGGQFYELLMGHDRMLADLRPQVLALLGTPDPIACHPYDVCTLLILEEAGCCVTDPSGSPLDAPMDTTSAISWVGFANENLDAHIRPAFDETLKHFFGEADDPDRPA